MTNKTMPTTQTVISKDRYHLAQPTNGGTKDVQVEITPPTTIVKRDGRTVPFDISRIESAITRCFANLGREPSTPVPELARQVVNIVAAQYSQPTVEEVQDIVEMVLQAAGEYEAAKTVLSLMHLSLESDFEFDSEHFKDAVRTFESIDAKADLKQAAKLSENL